MPLRNGGEEMYLELFLMDNTLMNALILRLACAFLSLKPRGAVLWAAAFCGALYAVFSEIWPILQAFPCKLAVGALMALALSGLRTRRFLLLWCAVLLSAVAIGGLSYALLFLFFFPGTILESDTKLRLALITASLAVFLPGLVRKLLARRTIASLTVRIMQDGAVHEFVGIIDSGNLLEDPLTGIPVILVYAPQLHTEGLQLLPYTTLDGLGSVFLLYPDVIEIKRTQDFVQVNAAIGISRTHLPYALVPAALVSTEI